MREVKEDVAVSHGLSGNIESRNSKVLANRDNTGNMKKKDENYNANGSGARDYSNASLSGL